VVNEYMTAQHAQRQGHQAGRNVAASLGCGKAHPYKHRNLGFLVDLGGLAAAANPLNIPLYGPPASVITRGYHIAGGDQCRVRSARRRQAASMTRQKASRRRSPP
jgi:NADH:ubiquinone reductase (H+-translocating)